MNRIFKAALAVAIIVIPAMVLAGGSGAGPVGEKNMNPSLGAPQGLKLAVVKGGFKLTWSPPARESEKVTGYEVLRAAMASGPFETVGTAKKGATEFVDTTASPENIYYYKVRAVADGQYSTFSNTVTGEMAGAP